MKTHILAGDALVATFRRTGIEGTIIISRECLIDGPVTSRPLDEFWKMRANYINAAYGEEESRYQARVAGEYEKVFALSSEDDVYLWFEYDLFCQVNMWFILTLLNRRDLQRIYRVAPTTRDRIDIWKGYKDLTIADFQSCFEDSVRFTRDDILFGASLWQAYQTADLKRLAELSDTQSICFPYLREVCNAEIERKKNYRPEKTLQRLREEGITDFNEIFRRFIEEEGIYGFGDLQVKALYEKISTEQND
jgi:hypothetical protein